MNKDQVAGRVEEAKGKMKEVAGTVTGSEKLQGEGVVDQAAGKVQKTYGDDRMFEIIVSAALGASRRRLFAGLDALEEA